MLKSLVTSMLVMGMFNQGVPSITAEVDRTEDNDMAVTLVYVDRGYREDYCDKERCCHLWCQGCQRRACHRDKA